MAIDFTLSPELEDLRLRVREFIQTVVKPGEAKIGDRDNIERGEYLKVLIHMRSEAKAAGLWLPHMPREWGGMGLGHVDLAMVQAEAAKAYYGPWVLNCQAPDEGNMHTLLHWATDAQKEKYLRPLCDGVAMSCFAMTEPEVAGSDPTLIKTRAVEDGDDWVIDGHKWFISNARRASFAILVARTEDRPDVPQAANTGFIVDIPSPGWNRVREIETMHGGTGHSEIRIEKLRVPGTNMLGGRGQGHRLGQYRLGPARLAHCMRWIAQAETALDMMVARSLERFSHGSVLAEKQGIQWMIADSTMELYQAKLMVLHAAYRIDKKLDLSPRSRWRSTSSPTRWVGSSTARSRCTVHSATRPTRRSRTCTSTPAGRASPTEPTRSTRCGSRSARSRPGAAAAARAWRPATCRSERRAPAAGPCGSGRRRGAHCGKDAGLPGAFTSPSSAPRKATRSSTSDSLRARGFIFGDSQGFLLPPRL